MLPNASEGEGERGRGRAGGWEREREREREREKERKREREKEKASEKKRERDRVASRLIKIMHLLLVLHQPMENAIPEKMQIYFHEAKVDRDEHQ